MLRIGRHFQYSKFPAIAKHDEYRIAPYDVLSFIVASKYGEKIFSGGYGQGGSGQGVGYSGNVETDGKIKFPIFGRIQIAGLTIREVETMLEEKMSAYIIEPFVQVRVSNKRIIILYSSGEGSRVVPLLYDNTTIFEVLSQSGGITGAKAYKIKLLRGDLRNPQIYLLDLSSVKGLIESDLVLQANDIIYLEVPRRLEQKIPQEISPFLAFFSTMLVFYGLFIKK
jgi:polysaccharide biosynthesis/export protein